MNVEQGQIVTVRTTFNSDDPDSIHNIEGGIFIPFKAIVPLTLKRLFCSFVHSTVARPTRTQAPSSKQKAFLLFLH